MKRVSIIPNIITSFGLACGLFVIFRVNMVTGTSFTLLQTMTLVILLAAFADVLDGAVARAVHGESEFGLAFDSLSDAISFGVAPSVLFLSSLKLEELDLPGFFALFAAMIYTICGVLRLVRFNIKQGIDKEEKNKAFIGLPIPAAAIAFISPNLLFHAPFFVKRVSLDGDVRGWILTAIGIFLAYLMLSKIRFASVKSFRFRFRSFSAVFLGSLLIIAFLYGLIYNLAILLLCVSWGYILISLFTAPFYKKKLKNR
jgi:CDP-diacylglycerol--serine O-phosphatidyltransferase